MEHYSSEKKVSALEAIKRMPVMMELDAEPSSEEMSKAVDSLSCKKAPGTDGILSKVIECGKAVFCLPTCTDSFVSAGQRGLCHKT